jgi:hypothetical protein
MLCISKSLLRGVKSRLNKQFFGGIPIDAKMSTNHLYIPEQSGNGTDHLTILLLGIYRLHPASFAHADHIKDDWFGIRPFAQHFEGSTYSKTNEESSAEQQKLYIFFKKLPTVMTESFICLRHPVGIFLLFYRSSCFIICI